MKMVYLVYDTEGSINIPIGAYSSEASARAALLRYLESNVGYSDSEWEEIAHAEGHDMDEFKDMILISPQFDKSLGMKVIEMELKD